MTGIIRPIAEQTSMHFIKNTNNRNVLMHCIQRAKKLQRDFDELNKNNVAGFCTYVETIFNESEE